MAQYFDDFTANDIGTAPAGWTSRTNAMALEVVADAEATGGKALKVGPGPALIQHSFASFDAVTADANRADFEVLVRSRATTTNASGQNLCGAAGRVFTTSTASAGFNGYTAGRRFTGWRDRLISTVSGGTVTILGTTAGTTVGLEVYAFGRFRVAGTTLQYRSWSGALEDEPTSWDVETTNSTHGSAGFIGVWRNLLTNNVHVDFFGVGTGGDAAPSGPVVGGSTLTTDSAWKIYTAAEINTAWAIRAALRQSASWAVFTRTDADSAWSIRTSSQAETSWTVRADLETETSWPIATAADTPTEWQIKAGVDTETAWPIFTAVDTATAWAILDSLALETPTAWAIRNALAAEAAWSIRTALDTGSAWAILSRLDLETAWQILGAGILDTPTAWAIRADLDQSTAWTIKTSLDADTDWTIIHGMDTATAWDILQGFATDTAWQVYRGLNTATAWSIISDTVPEPVRVFMAEPRDFIINAEKRIFILLAERK